MADKMVKGSVLMDQVRMIRGNKGKDWNQYIQPGDWDVINGRILPSLWYPLELFQRCGWANFKLLAGGNLDMVRAYGRIRAKELFGDIYKSVIQAGDFVKATERYNTISTSMFNIVKSKFEKVAEKHFRIIISFDSKDPTYEVYIYQLWGQLEAVAEMCGDKNAKIELIAREWKGDQNTIFDITWE